MSPLHPKLEFSWNELRRTHVLFRHPYFELWADIEIFFRYNDFYNAQIQIKMPFFCNFFRWMGGSIEFFMLIILTKIIFTKNRFLCPKNRFFEKIDPKGRVKYSSRDGGTKIFFVAYESSRPDLTKHEKWRWFRNYR